MSDVTQPEGELAMFVVYVEDGMHESIWSWNRALHRALWEGHLNCSGEIFSRTSR
ncbi:hypothetical protein BDR03DRAFT_960480, partial [Suillus americanus]